MRKRITRADKIAQAAATATDVEVKASTFDMEVFTKDVMGTSMTALKTALIGVMPDDMVEHITDKVGDVTKKAIADLVAVTGGARPTDAQLEQFQLQHESALQALLDAEFAASPTPNEPAEEVPAVTQPQEMNMPIDMIEDEADTASSQQTPSTPEPETSSQAVLRMLQEKNWSERIQTGVENRKKMGFFAKLFS